MKLMVLWLIMAGSFERVQFDPKPPLEPITIADCNSIGTYLTEYGYRGRQVLAAACVYPEHEQLLFSWFDEVYPKPYSQTRKF